MSTHDDNAPDTGLTPDERALARRLSKIGPQGEPSPALDARILAMAHAAASDDVEPVDEERPRVVQMRKRRPARWPTVFGFAASLALACGIAWQLRTPEHLAAPTAAQAPVEEGVEYRPPPPPSMSARVVPRRPLNVPVPPEEQAAARARSQSRAPAQAKIERKVDAYANAPIVLDEAVHPAPAAAAAAPPPPPAPAAIAMPEQQGVLAAEQAAAQRAQMDAANSQRAADSALERRQQAAAKAAASAARAEEPAFAEADEEVVPPATANDPAVRDAWLLRIRELVRAGNVDEARTSLKAFRARYPNFAVPEDLRALGE